MRHDLITHNVRGGFSGEGAEITCPECNDLGVRQGAVLIIGEPVPATVPPRRFVSCARCTFRGTMIYGAKS